MVIGELALVVAGLVVAVLVVKANPVVRRTTVWTVVLVAGVACVVAPAVWIRASLGVLSPPYPPSGPRSTIQSALRMTSRLCSMTISECPRASSARNARSASWAR